MFRRTFAERSNRGFKLLIEHIPDPTGRVDLIIQGKFKIYFSVVIIKPEVN